MLPMYMNKTIQIDPYYSNISPLKKVVLEETVAPHMGLACTSLMSMYTKIELLVIQHSMINLAFNTSKGIALKSAEIKIFITYCETFVF